jgi:hypothetical protein
VIVFYLLITAIGDINAAPFMRAGDSLWGLLCWVMPCSVLWPPRTEVPPKPPPPRQVTRLYFGKGKGKPERDCTCHVDIQSDGLIDHLRTNEDPPCSALYVVTTEWTWVPVEVPGGIDLLLPGGSMRKLKLGESVRWHCGPEQ